VCTADSEGWLAAGGLAAGVVVLVAIVVDLVGLGIWAFAVKGVRLPKFSFPADHGASASELEWLGGTVETIERHPQPSGAQHQSVTQSRQGEWLVSGTRVEVTNGMLFHGSPDPVDSRQMPPGCPVPGRRSRRRLLRDSGGAAFGGLALGAGVAY
jgi:hypothetical protein